MEPDVVIVGSGINALVCGAMLGLRGKRVLLLERNALAGGCIRTEELTLPGFRHDTLSTLYPLFVTAPHFAELGPALARHGVRFVNTDTPTATLLPDGRAFIFRTDRSANAAAFDVLAPGDGDAYRAAMAEIERGAPLIFGLLGNALWSWRTVRLLAGEARRRGLAGLARFFGEAMGSARDWLAGAFRSPVSRGLFAPWVLHVGLSPESAASALMNRLVLFSLEQAGAPMVAGGSDRIVAGFRALIEECGGELRTGTDVERILVERGRATGVILAGGETIRARRAVVASVTPTQLYGRLLPRHAVPPETQADAARFRYGRGEMQIHLALSEPPAWPDPTLGKVAMLHLTDGLDGVSQAVNEAERGLLPQQGTIVVAQPIALDPSRAPEGRWIFWIQLQELPRDGELRGDAAGEIEIPADGRWTEAVREAYADRIVARLSALIPNLDRSILGRHVISPADLARLNINLVDGDPYGGLCSIDQFMLWRPFATPGNHRTPIDRLYHIGASTHPGPGLGGMSGYLAAADLA
ncbi:phytoene desaturase family protein [Flavisphingomonas formosensis]|uniref:phytoene desaturase family protein n=1 Tax=Flavisphingomonas formosensis TaxID=861534 RepID=UPI0012F9B2D5|nr:NAD(P)/FAD-dependent oxidoreductase [Sphingomonas formosensis]